MTDAEIVKQANELAHMFFNALGYEITKPCKIYKLSHPRARVCWNLARIAFDKLLKTDIDDAIANTEELKNV